MAARCMAGSMVSFAVRPDAVGAIAPESSNPMCIKSTPELLGVTVGASAFNGSLGLACDSEMSSPGKASVVAALPPFENRLASG